MTARLILDLAVTLLGYALLACSYLGLGWGSSCILKIDLRGPERVFMWIWLGWAVKLALLQLLNLVLPITAAISAPLFMLGIALALAAWIIERREGPIPSLRWPYVIFLALAAGWFALLAMSAPAIADTGLYQFNSIRWLNEYPIVLGLGNLHTRLAYNQSLFAYTADLNLYPLFNHGHNLAISFLLLVLLAECVPAWLRGGMPGNAEDRLTAESVCRLLFIPVLIYLALQLDLSSPTPDAASAILQILIFLHFVSLLIGPGLTGSNEAETMVVFVLLATAITVKLSNAFFAVCVFTILLIVQLRRSGGSWKEFLAQTARWTALPAAILMLWSIRGLLLSGCPVFPSTFGCLGLEWAVPIPLVRNETLWIYSWARQPWATPDQVLGSWAWLAPWLEGIWQAKATVVYPVVVSILGLAASVLTRFWAPRSHPTRKVAWLIPIPAVIGLIAWFWIAPNLRFANALFWILPISILLVLMENLTAFGKPTWAVVALMFVLANVGAISAIAQNPRLTGGLSPAGYATIPEVKLALRTTHYGLQVWTPKTGDKCWDSAIPCTPYFNPELNFVHRNTLPEFILGPARGGGNAP